MSSFPAMFTFYTVHLKNTKKYLIICLKILPTTIIYTDRNETISRIKVIPEEMQRIKL